MNVLCHSLIEFNEINLFFPPFMFQGILEGPMFWKSHFTVFQKNASSLSSFNLCVCLTFLDVCAKQKLTALGISPHNVTTGTDIS